MSDIVNFFYSGHDFRLVLLAALVCLVSSYACVSLMRHAVRSSGRMRHIWILVSALAVGFGIWATHFVAMLAFRPGYEMSYDLALTGLSLLLAIAICGAGLMVAVGGGTWHDRLLGGATIGIGISSMHYVGIAALVLGGSLAWSPQLVVLSVISGVIFSSLAVNVGLRKGPMSVPAAAGLLTAAICAMHFTAMGAADFSQCFPVLPHGSQMDDGVLAMIVAFISLLILAAAIGGVVLDEADRRRTEREQSRQKADARRIEEVRGRLELALANMGHGLALFGPDRRLLLHNDRLAELLGMPHEVLREGMLFDDLCKRVSSLRMEVASEADEVAKNMTREHLDVVARGGGVIQQNLGDDTVFLVQHRAADGGGWVMTVEDVSESRRNQAAIVHLAQHDPLTGLPNRSRFNQLFDQALTEAEQGDNNLAVIAIDLDRFKEINDVHGHAAGDEVLQQLAERLGVCTGKGEVVARLGGDEFAALKSFTNMDDVRAFLQRLEGAICTRVTFGGFSMATSGSIGVSIYPEDGADRSKLLNNADLAMYRAKAEFDRRVCYYESQMDEHARERRAMAHDIWLALEQNTFFLTYQVQKSVTDQITTGYEVLLRWDRPGHGIVSPNDFIPVAEETGSIVALGNWVLKTACMEAATWPEPHKIAVNISGLQLAQIDLPDMVQMVLEQSGLPPERLELEVTETAIIADKKRAIHILKRIRAMGVSIAIDDFGTGYSSLDTLRSFPFDKIKLDRSFMGEVESDHQARAILRAILALGRSLSVPVLAEGVETSAQFQVLRDEGCDEVQGFLFGRPDRLDWSDLLELPLRA